MTGDPGYLNVSLARMRRGGTALVNRAPARLSRAGIIAPMSERGLPTEGAPACPFVAFEDDRDGRATAPDHRHRCFAEARPAPRALAHQEAYCLSSAFPVCPTFQDWARREAAAARPPACGCRGGQPGRRAAEPAAAAAGERSRAARGPGTPPPIPPRRAFTATGPRPRRGRARTARPRRRRGRQRAPDLDDPVPRTRGSRHATPRGSPPVAARPPTRASPTSGAAPPAGSPAAPRTGWPARTGRAARRPPRADDAGTPAAGRPARIRRGPGRSRDRPAVAPPGRPPPRRRADRRPRASRREQPQQDASELFGPAWERPRRYEAYPTLRTRMGLPALGGVPRLGVYALLLVGGGRPPVHLRAVAAGYRRQGPGRRRVADARRRPRRPPRRRCPRSRPRRRRRSTSWPRATRCPRSRSGSA